MPRLPPEAVEEAQQKAELCGATDPVFVGAGLEGIVFRSGGLAYKVRHTTWERTEHAKRLRTLQHEASILQFLNGILVPRFVAYSRELDVITREFVEGEEPAFDQIWNTHRLIRERLKGYFTPPERTESNFIKPATGAVIMVDLGMAWPEAS